MASCFVATIVVGIDVGEDHGINVDEWPDEYDIHTFSNGDLETRTMFGVEFDNIPTGYSLEFQQKLNDTLMDMRTRLPEAECHIVCHYR